MKKLVVLALFAFSAATINAQGTCDHKKECAAAHCDKASGGACCKGGKGKTASKTTTKKEAGTSAAAKN